MGGLSNSIAQKSVPMISSGRIWADLFRKLAIQYALLAYFSIYQPQGNTGTKRKVRLLPNEITLTSNRVSFDAAHTAFRLGYYRVFSWTHIFCNERVRARRSDERTVDCYFVNDSSSNNCVLEIFRLAWLL